MLSSFTPLVEGISLDEAFLDVTGSVHLLGGGPTVGARHPAQGAGGAPADLLGRRGPDQADGQVGLQGGQADGRRARRSPPARVCSWSTPTMSSSFLHPMPVRALWGVGPVTERRLARARRHDRRRARVGAGAPPSSGTWARPRAVIWLPLPGVRTAGPSCPSRRPSRSATRRPSPPTSGTGRICTADSNGWSTPQRPGCARSGKAARTVTVKLRFGDFGQVTRSHTLDSPIDAGPAIGVVAVRAGGLRRTGPRGAPAGGQPLRPGRSRWGHPTDGSPSAWVARLQPSADSAGRSSR